MAMLYFLGGEDIREEESISIHKIMFEDLSDPTMLIFEWTGGDEVKKQQWHDAYRAVFLNLGAGEVLFADSFMSNDDLIEQINNSDILYFPGGDSRELLANIHKRNLTDSLRQFDGRIAGNSAGAMAMADRAIFLEGQGNEPETSIGEGIGLVKICVSVHFGADNPHYAGRDKDLYRLSKEIGRIYAIPEHSALIVDGDRISSHGEVVIFEDGLRLS